VKTGWTIEQIGQLTFKQLGSFVNALVSEADEEGNIIVNPSAEEMELFHLSAGIQKVFKQK
jgi:hypothetical protein